MKVLCIFLSFLLLAMTMVPCQENAEAEKSGIELTAETKAGKHKTSEDNCNAFCQCSRCPFSVLIPAEAEPAPEKGLLSFFGAEPVLPVKNVSFAIWQPPRRTVPFRV